MPRRHLIGALTAAFMLLGVPAALALPVDPPGPPAVAGHQIINDSSALALTAGSSGNLYLAARSDTNQAQQFKRKTVEQDYGYRYESLRYPGQCIGVSVVNQFGTPHLKPCSSPTTEWRFYSPYPDPSRGELYLEYWGVMNGQALHPSGTSVVLGDDNWSTIGADAHWHDRTIAID